MRNLFDRMPILLLLCFCAVGPAKAQRVLFADRDPVVLRQTNGTNPAYYMQLFTPEAPWTTAAATVSVLSVVAQLSSMAPTKS